MENSPRIRPLGRRHLDAHVCTSIPTPVEVAHRFDYLLAQNKRKHQACIYSGDRHEFIIPQSTSYKAEDAKDARAKMFGFLDTNLKSAPKAVCY